MKKNYSVVWYGRDLKDATPSPPALSMYATFYPRLHIQPGLEHFHGWDIHNFPGQELPVPHHSHRKECPI